MLGDDPSSTMDAATVGQWTAWPARWYFRASCSRMNDPRVTLPRSVLGLGIPLPINPAFRRCRPTVMRLMFKITAIVVCENTPHL